MIKLPKARPRKLNSERSLVRAEKPQPKPIPDKLKSKIIKVVQHVDSATVSRFKTTYGSAQDWVPFSNVDVDVFNKNNCEIRVTVPVGSDSTGNSYFAHELAAVVCPKGTMSDWMNELKNLGYVTILFIVTSKGDSRSESVPAVVELPDSFDYNAETERLKNYFYKPILDALKNLGFPDMKHLSWNLRARYSNSSTTEADLIFSLDSDNTIFPNAFGYVANVAAYAAAPHFLKAGIKTLNVMMAQYYFDSNRPSDEYEHTFDLASVSAPGTPPAKLFADASEFAYEDTIADKIPSMIVDLEPAFIKRYGDEVRYKSIDADMISDTAVKVTWITQEDFDETVGMSMMRIIATRLSAALEENGIKELQCRVVCRDGKPEVAHTFTF
jgi:hypothetical protein